MSLQTIGPEVESQPLNDNFAELLTMPVWGMSRNALINGNFDVWQRETSFTNPSGAFTTDRYRTSITTDGGVLPTNIIHSQQSAIGLVSNASYFYRMNNDSVGSGFGNNAIYQLRHVVENGTRYLCGNGKKLTLSFWARSTISNKRIGVAFAQHYGSGGSPTAAEDIPGAVFTLTSTFTKYTLTVTTNTLTGKTFGTNKDDRLELYMATMWGSNKGTNFGGATAEGFVGSGNIDIAQIQVNAGDQALPFQPKSYADELQSCQRYCYVQTETSTQFPIGYGSAASTTVALIGFPFNVQMRVPPTLVATASDWQLNDGGAAIDLTAIAIQGSQNGKNYLTIRADVAAGLTQYRPYALNADGTANRKIIFDAEI